MANEQNLTHKGILSSEQAKRMAANSAKVRKQQAEIRKTAKMVFKYLLDKKIKNAQSGETISGREALAMKAFAKGLQEGDLNAIKYVFEMADEGAAQKMEITGADGAPLINNEPLTKKQMKQLFKELEKE